MARSNSASMVAVSFCRRPGITGASSSSAVRRTLTGCGNGGSGGGSGLGDGASTAYRGWPGSAPANAAALARKASILGVSARRHGGKRYRGVARSATAADGGRVGCEQGSCERLAAVHRGARLAACIGRWLVAVRLCSPLRHVAGLRSLLLRGLVPAGRDDRGRRDVAGDVPLRHPVALSHRLPFGCWSAWPSPVRSWGSSSPSTGVQSR